MKWTTKHAALATLAYAELFEYPLTKKELYLWLITNTHISLQHVPLFHRSNETYLSLSSKRRRIHTRMRREKISAEKWKIASKVARILSHIPTIQLLGVSGGLAMDNADRDDDIDLFIVVYPNTLWVSRMLVLFVLEFIGKRRKLGDTVTADKICPNMFVDSDHLSIPKGEQDLYSAHEVLQMVPLTQKKNIYEQFLKQNSWVNQYLYNAWKEKNSKVQIVSSNKSNLSIPYYLLLATIYLFEFPAKYFQLWYMRKHRTTEIISDSILRFHPRDTRVFVRRNYVKLLRKYKIPLDSGFLDSLQ